MRILFISLLILTSSNLTAQTKRHLDDIVPGMTKNDVQRVWGAPDDRDEFESKREEAWTYEDYHIKFRENKVLSIVKKSPAYTAFYQVKEEKKPKAPAQGAGPKDVAVEDILSEITQDPEPANKGKKSKRRR